MHNPARLSITIKKLCESHILRYYSFTKQFNIQALQGYTQDDKNKMWVFINSCRARSKELRSLCESGELTSLAQINYSDITP